MVIVGNKVDLKEDRAVTQDAAHSIAQQHKMNYHETSAKSGTGVEQMINDVLS